MAEQDERRVAHVLLDTPLPQLDHLFDYEVPEALRDRIRPGQRVRVPLRSQARQSIGWVISLSAKSSYDGKLQQVTDVLGDTPVLTPEIWQLARSVADRAAGSASDVLRHAIPPRMVRAEKQHTPGVETPWPMPETFHSEFHSDVGQQLIRSDRCALTPQPGVHRLPTGEWVGVWAYDIALIAQEVLAQGKSVIICAPDYRDVDSILDACEALGAPDVVRVDARQSRSARYASFLRTLDPVARIIVGNRSAVYSPAHQLGAIVMFDDGDPLFGEPTAPYVHARDAALIRSDQQGCGLLFISHCRSIEVQRLVDIDYVSPVSRPVHRPKVIAADAVADDNVYTSRVPEFAARLIRTSLEHGPVLVQVATAGYAPAAACATCEERAHCRGCGGPLKFSGNVLAQCRLCGELSSAWKCSQCGGKELIQRGSGSVRTAEQLRRQFAQFNVIVSDRDTPLTRVDSRPALVVATRGAEPLAATGYRAVVILDAPQMLAREALSAGEDCLRWWHNALSLASSDATCLVAQGSGSVINAFVSGRVHEWLQAELHERKVLRFPPAVRIATVTGTSTAVQCAISTLDGISDVDVLGPTPVSEHDTHTGRVRAIVRFGYASGREVAVRLRAAVVAEAAGSASGRSGRNQLGSKTLALHLRFDDRSVLDATETNA